MARRIQKRFASAAGFAPATIAVALLAFLAIPIAPAAAAPKPVEEKTAAPTDPKKKDSKKEANETKSGGEKAPIPKTLPELRMPGQPPSTPAPNDVYRALLRTYSGGRSPADTMGNGIFTLSRSAFYAGNMPEAMARSVEFTRTYTRNLNLNDALEMQILIRGYRDFDDLPLKAYARMLSWREAGHPDSATTAGKAALEKWPGAKVRHHIHFELAEMARDRGDHATAMTHALAVADPSTKSRLAPAALKLAGDEAVAAGQGQDRALRIYQELLERYPDSPLAPQVRAQAIEMRKRLQL